ncbi:MAG TPA: nucleoside monophosphate kinase [Candidatus Nanoarchaeia archaeon]|nr:nucleoside monophosphate kinase [Candidatus Nanoarchaeia archaeon]
MKVAIIGIQGSGKGTQAAMLAKATGWQHISTGDVLRDEISRETALGKKLAHFLDKGDLAPDHVVFSLMLPYLHKRHFILDGYPRSMAQVIPLDKEVILDKVVVLTMPDNEVYRRLGARRQCKQCHEIYGLNRQPSKAGACDECGGKLFKRDDDKPEAIEERLKIFHTETMQVIRHYKKKGIATEIDAARPVEDVFADIRKLFKV